MEIPIQQAKIYLIIPYFPPAMQEKNRKIAEPVDKDGRKA